MKFDFIKPIDMETNKKKLTTASGIPYAENENSQTVGPRGPILLQDFILFEKSAAFNRERIPERVVHAKGSGAYGTFTVTKDITHLTKVTPPPPQSFSTLNCLASGRKKGESCGLLSLWAKEKKKKIQAHLSLTHTLRTLTP